MCFSKIPNSKWVNNNSNNNADDDDDDNNKRKRRSLPFSSGVHFIAEYIWKVNTALNLVQSFELNNDGQLRNTFVSWSLAVNWECTFPESFHDHPLGHKDYT